MTASDVGTREMPQHRLKTVLGLFFLLSSLFGVNLFAFQSTLVATAAKRIVFPAGGAAQPVAQVAHEGGRVAPAAGAGEDFSDVVADTQSSLTTGSVSEPDLTRAVQRELQVLGYEAGGVDGVAGLTTRAAIMAFEWDAGLPLTGEPAQHVLQALLMGSGRNGVAGAGIGVPPSIQAAQVIRTVQQGLTALGYGSFKNAGMMTAETQRALRLFEVHEGLTETGRISGTLASRVMRLSGEKRLADGR